MEIEFGIGCLDLWFAGGNNDSMKVVIAIDSFKGSMTSLEAGKAAKSGVLCAIPDAEVVVKPLADGGEGTTDALIQGMRGKRISIKVTGPMGEPVTAEYGILEDGVTAVMEMAQAAGITKVPEGMRNPLQATTFGVGEMIKDAVLRGCRAFLIGIGGSATNDAGLGMLKALGFCFLDKNGIEVGEGAAELERICTIQTNQVMAELSECSFKIACDVTNPLCGKQGATYIYGPQKGLGEEMLASVDKGMKHFAEVTEKHFGGNFQNVPGAGAAGGLGFAFLSFLKGNLMPGVDLILDVIHLEEELSDADFAITGEGKIDGQTAMGKAPVGVAKLAKKYGCTVLAFAGSVDEGAGLCHEAGIDAIFPIVRGVVSLEEAMRCETARANMANAVEQVFRVIRSI